MHRPLAILLASVSLAGCSVKVTSSDYTPRFGTTNPKITAKVSGGTASDVEFSADNGATFQYLGTTRPTASGAPGAGGYFPDTGDVLLIPAHAGPVTVTGKAKFLGGSVSSTNVVTFVQCNGNADCTSSQICVSNACILRPPGFCIDNRDCSGGATCDTAASRCVADYGDACSAAVQCIHMSQSCSGPSPDCFCGTPGGPCTTQGLGCSSTLSRCCLPTGTACNADGDCCGDDIEFVGTYHNTSNPLPVRLATCDDDGHGNRRCAAKDGARCDVGPSGIVACSRGAAWPCDSVAQQPDHCIPPTVCVGAKNASAGPTTCRLCGGTSATCSTSDDCCGGSDNICGADHRCRLCGLVDQNCLSASDCCSGRHLTCNAQGKCTCAGVACTTAADCCPGSAFCESRSGHPATCGGFCLHPQDPCTDDSECCSGACTTRGNGLKACD